MAMIKIGKSKAIMILNKLLITMIKVKMISLAQNISFTCRYNLPLIIGRGADGHKIESVTNIGTAREVLTAFEETMCAASSHSQN